MEKFKKILVFIILSIGLTGCTHNPPPFYPGKKQALINSQFGSGVYFPVVNGTLPGTYIANWAGGYLDPHSVGAANQAAQTALYYGQSNYWRTPTSAGRIYPLRAYRFMNRVCRPFTVTFWVAGRIQTVSGTACRNSLGQWVMR